MPSLEPSKDVSKISCLVYNQNKDITAAMCADNPCETSYIYQCDDVTEMCVGDCIYDFCNM